MNSASCTGLRLATGYGLYVAERLLGHSVTPSSPQATTQTSPRGAKSGGAGELIKCCLGVCPNLIPKLHPSGFFIKKMVPRVGLEPTTN